MASPAWPPPITTVSIRSTVSAPPYCPSVTETTSGCLLWVAGSTDRRNTFSSCQMRRYAYGGDGTNMVHAEAEGGALGALEERSMYSRHCPGARAKEQERRVPRIGFERRHYPGSTS